MSTPWNWTKNPGHLVRRGATSSPSSGRSSVYLPRRIPRLLTALPTPTLISCQWSPRRASDVVNTTAAHAAQKRHHLTSLLSAPVRLPFSWCCSLSVWTLQDKVVLNISDNRGLPTKVESIKNTRDVDITIRFYSHMVLLKRETILQCLCPSCACILTPSRANGETACTHTEHRTRLCRSGMYVHTSHGAVGESHGPEKLDPWAGS
jgi:hypothetical protein